MAEGRVPTPELPEVRGKAFRKTTSNDWDTAFQSQQDTARTSSTVGASGDKAASQNTTSAANLTGLPTSAWVTAPDRTSGTRASAASHSAWGQERLARMLTRELLQNVERAVLPAAGSPLADGGRVTLACESQHIGPFELSLSRTQGKLAVRIQVANESIQAQLMSQRQDIEAALRGIGQTAVSFEISSKPAEKRKDRRRATRATALAAGVRRTA